MHRVASQARDVLAGQGLLDTAVHALGRALYAVPGLVDPGPLARFWADPRPGEPGAFDLLRRALWSECLLNAGFHSREGLARLAPAAATRMLDKAA